MTALLFHIEQPDAADPPSGRVQLHLCGDWQLGHTPDGESLCAAIPADSKTITLITDELKQWDSSLAVTLLQLARWCEQQQISLDTSATPENRWRSHAHLLFQNWINEIYQSTPYDLAQIGRV